MRSECALAVMLAAAVRTRALKLHTPSKWNVEHANILTWEPETDDPAQFSAELRHPWFVHGPLAIISAANTVDSGALVWLPALPTSNLYHIEAIEVGNINKVFATTKNFTIVTDDSPASSFTLSFATPAQDNLPSPTPLRNASASTIPATEASSTTTGAEHSATPSLSYSGAPGRPHAAHGLVVAALSVAVAILAAS